MIPRFFASVPVFLGLSLALHAQENEEVVPLKFRAVLHDPVNPVANLFYAEPSGERVPLSFRPKALTETLLSPPINGRLVLFDNATVDPENPMAGMAASVRIPERIRQAIVVVMPGPPDQGPPYRMLVIDDSRNAFPPGESRVLPLVGVEIGVQAGEHRLSVRPGKITRVPPVKKVNEFNMAQTNFFYKRGESWTVFTERQLQYLDACRRLFIVHATPGAVAPTVTTIVDMARVGLPR
ncbi:hypothetical protein [Haloferula sp. A504]|uniref:hypothetical protein n=1 Tax=Haloferula sp. A504 TaxID=3373601 RepID=UPI0031CA0234|nr:hypothetical protein [Verrucomicrobiaceae bacterium E54]